MENTYFVLEKLILVFLLSIIENRLYFHIENKLYLVCVILSYF